MHITKPHPRMLQLRNRRGHAVDFESLAELYAYAKQHGYIDLWGGGGIVGVAFGPRNPETGFLQPPHLIIACKHGDEPFDGPITPARKRNWRFGVFRLNGCGTGRGKSRWLRYPQTQNERRWLASGEEELRELGLHPKEIIRDRKPPSSWDDQARDVQKNWKRQRRTQWKP